MPMVTLITVLSHLRIWSSLGHKGRELTDCLVDEVCWKEGNTHYYLYFPNFDYSDENVE